MDIKLYVYCNICIKKTVNQNKINCYLNLTKNIWKNPENKLKKLENQNKYNQIYLFYFDYMIRKSNFMRIVISTNS